MADTLLALGDFRFSIDTAAYQEFQRTTEYRWPKQERIGQGPARQFVGLGDDTITLPGVVYPHNRGGLGQVATMRAMAGQGLPLMLVSGTGEVLGKFVIETVEENASAFFSDGAPRRQAFSLKLGRYFEDGPSPDAYVPRPVSALSAAVASALVGDVLPVSTQVQDAARLAEAQTALRGLTDYYAAPMPGGLSVAEQQLFADAQGIAYERAAPAVVAASRKYGTPIQDASALVPTLGTGYGVGLGPRLTPALTDVAEVSRTTVPSLPTIGGYLTETGYSFRNAGITGAGGAASSLTALRMAGNGTSSVPGVQSGVQTILSDIQSGAARSRYAAHGVDLPAVYAANPNDIGGTFDRTVRVTSDLIGRSGVNIADLWPNANARLVMSNLAGRPTEYDRLMRGTYGRFV